MASVIIPNRCNPGATVAIAFVNFPFPSFNNKKLSGASGYFPEIARPPINKSGSPSPSASADFTQEPILVSIGSAS